MGFLEVLKVKMWKYCLLTPKRHYPAWIRVRWYIAWQNRFNGLSSRSVERLLRTKKDIKEELSYRQQIARQLRTQFVEGISVTLKSTLRITQGHWKRTIGQIIHDLLLDELLDVEYYRDLEMWIRGHSVSLKVKPFESLGTVSLLFLP